MEMNDVLNMLISSGAAEEVSKQTGITADDAVAVMQEVLPTLIQGMQGQAKNTSTQQSFLQALSDHSKQDTKDLGKFVRNVDTDDGDKIVNHLLGGKKEDVAAKAKKKSGIDTKTVIKIMAILAPILMAKMGKNAEEEKKAKAKKNSSADMVDVVTGMLDGVDAGDVVKILSVLMK